MSEFYPNSSKLSEIKRKDWKYDEMLVKVPFQQSFGIPDSEISLNKLRVMLTRKGKELGKVFKAFHHKIDGVYEIGYIGNRPEGPKKKAVTQKPQETVDWRSNQPIDPFFQKPEKWDEWQKSGTKLNYSDWIKTLK